MVWRPTSNRKCVCGAAFGGHDALRQGPTCTQFIRSNCNVDAEFAFNQKDSLPKYNLTEMGQRSPTTRANASDPAFGPFADYSFIFAEYSYFDRWIAGFAALSLLVNGTVLTTLSSYRNSDQLHLRAAWIDTRADVLVNAAVLISGVLIAILSYRLIDLAVGAAVAAFVIHEGWELWEASQGQGARGDAGAKVQS